MSLSIIKDVLFRSIALFMTMALPAIGAGAFAGVEVASKPCTFN